MRFLHIILPLMMVVLVSACANEIDPLTDEGQDMFAIHGYLDASADTQFVRIEALRATVLEPPATLEQIRVESMEVETGERIAWRDSLVTLVGGDEGVIFWAKFRPQAGQTYQLFMYRPGREGASARTTIPEPARLVVHPPTGQDRFVRQRVSLEDVVRPEHVRMRYEVRNPDTGQTREVTVAYGNPTVESGNDWSVLVQLKIDHLIVLRELDKEEDDQTVGLRRLAISYYLQGPEWRNPADVSHLTNTTGFFGSVGYYEQEWELDAGTLAEIGYVNEQ